MLYDRVRGNKTTNSNNILCRKTKLYPIESVCRGHKNNTDYGRGRLRGVSVGRCAYRPGAELKDNTPQSDAAKGGVIKDPMPDDE